jgi:hypothetical protein
MEELLKLANRMKEQHPSLEADIDLIVEECKYYVETRGDEKGETTAAIEIINDIVNQLEEYDN